MRIGLPGLELGARLRGRFQIGLTFSVLVPAGSLRKGGFTDLYLTGFATFYSPR
jgi:hypothetical protein